MKRILIELRLKFEVPEKAHRELPPPRDYAMWKRLLATCIDRALWVDADSDAPSPEKDFSDAEYVLLQAMLESLRKET